MGRCCWVEAKGAADHGERRRRIHQEPPNGPPDGAPRALGKGVEEEEERPCRGGERGKGGSFGENSFGKENLI